MTNQDFEKALEDLRKTARKASSDIKEVQEKYNSEAGVKLLDLMEYVDVLQMMVEWLNTYMKYHKETNITQHEIMRLETAKDKGVDIDSLKKDMQEILGKLQ